MHYLGAVEYEEKLKKKHTQISLKLFKEICTTKTFPMLLIKKMHIIFAKIMDMDKRKLIHQFSGTV